MVDITADIDVSALVDGQVADAADVLDPIVDLIGVINDFFTGDRAADQINLAAATELTIASGTITVALNMHTVDTQSDASSDDLDTINMAEGDWVFLRAAHTDRTVVLRHGTGNIATSTGENLSLDDTNKVVLAVRIGSTVHVVGASGVTAAINVGPMEVAFFL